MGDSYLEIPLTITPSRMLNGLILHGDTLIPTVVPLVIQSVTPITCVCPVSPKKQVNFGIGTPFKWVKLRKNAINEENFTYSITIFEGDAVVMNNLESITYEIQFTGTPNCHDEGSIYKSMYKCHTTFITKDGQSVQEILVQSNNAYQSEIVKAIEAFLYANPYY
ncbi:hypothetical protein Acr_22g0008420 [Actinidia rufa]|uniref:Uncharacterized protein n=1 Tax=Actinidia rufa TaxID=165716 RepID=A0A7J0GL60_9ERIC|nr:hypothetical protein Acr_22g0008420 [Actinidia rufa]